MTAPTSAAVRLLLHRCGLSQTDAAAFLRNSRTGEPVESRLVRRWISGEYPVPDNHWQALLDLCTRQDRAAEEMLALIRDQGGAGPRSELTLRMARTDEEAECLGWPCVGAHIAVIRRVVEWAPKKIKVTPVYAGEDPVAP